MQLQVLHTLFQQLINLRNLYLIEPQLLKILLYQTPNIKRQLIQYNIRKLLIFHLQLIIILFRLLLKCREFLTIELIDS